MYVLVRLVDLSKKSKAPPVKYNWWDNSDDVKSEPKVKVRTPEGEVIQLESGKTLTEVITTHKGYMISFHPEFGYSVVKPSPYELKGRRLGSEAEAMEFIETLEPHSSSLFRNSVQSHGEDLGLIPLGEWEKIVKLLPDETRALL